MSHSTYARDTTGDRGDTEDDAQSKPTVTMKRQYGMHGPMCQVDITGLLYTIASMNNMTLSATMTIQYIVNNCKWGPYVAILCEQFTDMNTPIAPYLF